MHQPRSYGLFGSLKSDDDANEVELLARRLTNIKTLGGLDSLRMVKTLPSGGLAIAQDMGGVFKVFVRPADEPLEERYTEPTSSDFIPMLFSGRIATPIRKPDEPVELFVTKTTRRRLSGYKKDTFDKENMAPELLKLQRFVIKHSPAFMELEGKSRPEIVKTQFANQHPTWYSGAMAEVVQIVSGYGRLDSKLPTKKPKPGEKDNPMREYERMQLTLPAKWKALHDAEVINLRVPGAKGRPPESGQIQFDYRFNKTHGVGFDSKGKPWLIQVAAKGVHAMPLPLVPATTSKSFRKYMEEVEDDEIIAILDRYGGLPSGESFPSTVNDGFEAWRRAGVIIKVCDAADFYQHIAYSSACGWSFNSKGTEGFNTCYDYDDDKQIGYGLSYQLSLTLGESTDTRRKGKSLLEKDARKADLFGKYLALLYSAMGTENLEKHRAIKYKLMRRVPVDDVVSRAEDYFRLLSEWDDGAKLKVEMEYWDKLETEPIAKHSGSIVRVGRGWLYNRAKFETQPQIKFPEPIMDGCVSHDFLPLIGGRYRGFYPNCDTIMFGYYVGDQLKVVKYFLDTRTYKEDIDSNFEEYMAVGSWKMVEAFEPTSLQGHFYSSDFDERKAGSPSTKTTKIVGTDLGYSSTPEFEFDDFFSTIGTLQRKRYYQHLTNIDSTENKFLSVAVCIPYLSRNALLHATSELTTGISTTESLSVHFVTDPNSYRYYTYDFVYAWVGNSYAGNMATAEKPSQPKDGNPVWVLGYNYYPAPQYDFADEGDWLGGVPQDYTWLIHPKRGEWRHSGGGGGPTVKTYINQTSGGSSEAKKLDISILPNTGYVHKSPASAYFAASPDEFMGVFYRDAVKNCFGDATYASVSEDDPEAPKQRKRFGHTRMANHQSAHFFIGVINE